MRRTAWIFVVPTVLLLLACPGTGRTVKERTKSVQFEKSLEALDLGIKAGVQENLASDLYIRMQMDKIKVSVTHRVVVLEGVVETADQKKKAETLARAVMNVRDVINKLTVSGKQEVTGVFDG